MNEGIVEQRRYGIRELDEYIEDYVRKNPNKIKDWRLSLEEVPRRFIDLMETLLPEEKMNEWLQDKEAFKGESPIDLISILDSKKIRENILRIKHIVREVASYIFTPEIPSYKEVLYDVRLAQAKKLGLK